MKRLLPVISIILFSIAACYDDKTDLYYQLELIDSLIANKNDNIAQTKLDSLDRTGATEHENAYYNLLNIKIKYTQPISKKLDSVINVTEDYYLRHGDKIKKTQILLFKGAHLIFNDEYTLAEPYLSKAEKAAIDNGMSLELSIINWLRIISCDYLRELEKAKTFSDRQIAYAQASGNNTQLTYAYLNRAILYRKLNQNDSAFDSFQKVLLRDYWVNSSDKSFVYNALGEIIIDKDTTDAIRYFKKSLECNPNPMADYNLAKIYLSKNNIAEAEKIVNAHLQELWPEQNIDFLKIGIRCRLLHGDSTGAYNHLQNIVNQKDSIISRMERNRQMKNGTTLPTKTDEFLLPTILVLIFCTIIVVVFLVLRRNFKRKIKHISNEICRKCHSEDNFLKAKSDIADLKAIVDKQERELKNVYKQLSEYNQFNTEGEYLMNKIKNNQHFDNNDLKNIHLLRAYYGFQKPEFSKKLNNSYCNLTDNQLLYLILCDCGKSESEMMALFGIGASSLRSIKSRIKSRNQ